MMSFKILDGSMGSELIRRELNPSLYTWSADANITSPDMVEKIHREHLSAGADYITTNTFRTTPRAYNKTSAINPKTSARTSLYKAVDLAKKSARKSVKVLGSIAPLEDCYLPNLFPGRVTAIAEFTKLGKWLKDADVDILLLETMNSAAETEAALIATQDFNLPIWVSFVLKDGFRLLSGDSMIDTLNMVKNYPVDTVLLNCNPLDRTVIAAENLVTNWSNKWGVYPNLGVGEPSPNGYILHYEKMDRFLSTMEKVIDLGPSIIGACCGSSWKHILKLFELRKQYNLV